MKDCYQERILRKESNGKKNERQTKGKEIEKKRNRMRGNERKVQRY